MVVGIAVVVVLVGVVFAWKALGPPAPPGIKPFDRASLATSQKKHAESAAQIRQEQMQALQESKNGGGR